MKKVQIDLDSKVQVIEHENKKYKITIETIDEGYCICGCGEKALNRSKYFSAACRKRVSRRKQKDSKN